MMSMRTHASLPLILLLGASILPERANAQANTQSNPAPSPAAADSDSSSWLFPIEKLDEALPSWLHIGGEYRDRLEGPIGIGYQGTNDFYVLDRLRVTVAIQPKDWLKFYGEVQDSRIFFTTSPTLTRSRTVGPFGKATFRSVVPHQVGSMRLQGAKSSSLATSA